MRIGSAKQSYAADAALFDTVKAVGMDLCPALGVSIPVGKDSLSMRTKWDDQQVTAPVSLIVSAFASIADVRGTLTPQWQPEDSCLILVDLGQGKHRLAGSILAQTLNQFGNDVPDLDDPQQLVALVNAVNELRAAGITPVLMTEPRWGMAAKVNGLGEHPNLRLEQYMAACREVSKAKQVSLVDHFQHWTDAEAKGTDLGTWTTDQCHPNPAGHRVLAELLLPVVRAALKPAP